MVMQKIQVVVLEKYKDTTVRYLSEAGLVHFKEVYKPSIDEWDYLAPFKPSPETSSRYQTLTYKFSSFFRENKLSLPDYAAEEQSKINVSGEVLLESLEERLNNLPLDHMQKTHNYQDRIDRFLKTLMITED